MIKGSQRFVGFLMLGKGKQSVIYGARGCMGFGLFRLARDPSGTAK